MKEFKVGILGCGTIGTGVAKLLLERQELLASRVGAKLTLHRVADLDTTTDRGITFEEGVFIDDAFKVVDDPEIDIVVEMIGGETFAKDVILRAIENGKHIVTANKALIASHGNEILGAAAKKNVNVEFEAAVGGCMPIIKTMREALVANNIRSMMGILNGTCNYILSRITEDGSTFEDALKTAQELGFAEADPTLDVEGYDTAHKLAILTALAYGMEINLKDIHVEGITKVGPIDIDFARKFGYRIKLLAISKNNGENVEARIHPTMIPEGHLLANVNGSLNAINVDGDAVENVLLYGHGAGMLPTASAVVSDIVDIVRNLITGGTGRVPALSYQKENIKPVPVMPIDETVTRYYFRFAAKDQPGVLSKISGILGDHGISLQSVHQTEQKSDGTVPVVMLSHVAKEDQVQKAVEKIAALDVIDDKPVMIRIEDLA